jgi:hypothetical protein
VPYDHEGLDLLIDHGTAGGLALGGTVELLRDAFAVPAENSIRRDDGGDFRESFLPSLPTDLGQGLAFPITQAYTTFHLVAQRSNSLRQARTRPAGGSSPRDALPAAARWHVGGSAGHDQPTHPAGPQSQSPSTAASSSAASPFVSPARVASPSLRSSAVCFSVAGCCRQGASASTSRITPRCRA